MPVYDPQTTKLPKGSLIETLHNFKINSKDFEEFLEKLLTLSLNSRQRKKAGEYLEAAFVYFEELGHHTS